MVPTWGSALSLQSSPPPRPLVLKWKGKKIHRQDVSERDTHIERNSERERWTKREREE